MELKKDKKGHTSTIQANMYQRLNARPSLQVRRAPCGTSRLHADIHSSRASASDRGTPSSSSGFHVAGIGRGRGGKCVKSKKKSLYSRAWYSTPHYKKGQKCTLDLRDETLELLTTTFLWWRRGGGSSSVASADPSPSAMHAAFCRLFSADTS